VALPTFEAGLESAGIMVVVVDVEVEWVGRTRQTHQKFARRWSTDGFPLHKVSQPIGFAIWRL